PGRGAFGGAGFEGRVQYVVVDDDGGDHHTGPALVFALGKQADIHEHASADALDALARDLIRKILDDGEGITGNGARVRTSSIGVVVVLEGQGAVGLNAAGEIGVAAGDQDEVARERAVRRERSRAVDARVEAIVGAQELERGPFGEELGG